MCVCVEWVGLCVLVGGVYGLGQRERRAYPYPITPLQNRNNEFGKSGQDQTLSGFG